MDPFFEERRKTFEAWKKSFNKPRPEDPKETKLLEEMAARKVKISKMFNETVQRYQASIQNEPPTPSAPPAAPKSFPHNSTPRKLPFSSLLIRSDYKNSAQSASTLTSLSSVSDTSATSTLLTENDKGVIKAMCAFIMFGSLAYAVFLFPFGIYFAVPIMFIFFCAFLIADDSENGPRFFVPGMVFIIMAYFLLGAVFYAKFFMEEKYEDPPIYALKMWILIACCYFIVGGCRRWAHIDQAWNDDESVDEDAMIDA